MTQETKHTPTPWTYERNPNTASTWNIMQDGLRVAEVLSSHTKLKKDYFGGVYVDPDDAIDGPHNAEFIVRACNAHEALVEALSRILALADSDAKSKAIARVALSLAREV